MYLPVKQRLHFKLCFLTIDSHFNRQDYIIHKVMFRLFITQCTNLLSMIQCIKHGDTMIGCYIAVGWVNAFEVSGN